MKHERGKRFNEKNTGWQKNRMLSSLEQFQLRLEMENREFIKKQIERFETATKLELVWYVLTRRHETPLS